MSEVLCLEENVLVINMFFIIFLHLHSLYLLVRSLLSLLIRLSSDFPKIFSSSFLFSIFLCFPCLSFYFHHSPCPIFLYPETPTPDPRSPVSNVTLTPLQKEELARIKRKQLANAVHYIWETGEDKYMLRYFHTGFWLSCEKHNEGL